MVSRGVRSKAKKADEQQGDSKKASKGITKGNHFLSALTLYRLEQAKQKPQETSEQTTRSTARVDVYTFDDAQPKSPSRDENAGGDSQIVGWDHTEVVENEEEGGRTPRIENLLPKHSIPDQNVSIQQEMDIGKEFMAPPSSQPRESSPMKFEDEGSSQGDVEDSGNTREELISPDRGSQTRDGSIGIPSTEQSPASIRPSSKSQSQSQSLPTLTKSELQSPTNLHKVSASPSNQIRKEVYDWDSSMSKEEVDEAVEAAKIAEKNYEGPKLIDQIVKDTHSSRANNPKATASQGPKPKSKWTEKPTDAVQQKILQFIAMHEFSGNREKGIKPRILTRRQFTRDLYDYSRAMGLSSDQADYQIRLARFEYRQKQGLEIEDDDCGSEFGDEIDDTEEVIQMLEDEKVDEIVDEVVAGVEEERVENDPSPDINTLIRVETESGSASSSPSPSVSEKSAGKVKATKSTGARQSQQSKNQNSSTSTQNAVPTGALLAQDSRQEKRKRDIADDGERHENHLNPNGSIEKASPKLSKKQKIAAAREKKSAMQGSKNGVENVEASNATVVSTTPIAPMQTKEEDQKQPPTLASEEGIASATSDPTEPVKEQTSEARRRSSKGGRRHRKAKVASEGTNLESASVPINDAPENVDKTNPTKPVEEQAPKVLKKKKRGGKKVKKANVVSGGTEIESAPMPINDAPEDVDMVDATTVEDKEPAQIQLDSIQTESKGKPKKKKKRKQKGSEAHGATEVDAAGTETVAKGNLDSAVATDTENPGAPNPQKKPKQKGATGQSAGTTKTDNTEEVVAPKPRKETKQKGTTDQTAGKVELEPDIGGAGKSKKRDRGPRNRAANAGLGREQTMENPLNQNSTKLEAPNQPKSTTSSNGKRSREDETASIPRATKKARRVSFSEDVDDAGVSHHSKVKKEHQNDLGIFAAKSERHRSLEALQDTNTKESKQVSIKEENASQGTNAKEFKQVHVKQENSSQVAVGNEVKDESKPKAKSHRAGRKNKSKNLDASGSGGKEGNDHHL